MDWRGRWVAALHLPRWKVFCIFGRQKAAPCLGDHLVIWDFNFQDYCFFFPCFLLSIARAKAPKARTPVLFVFFVGVVLLIEQPPSSLFDTAGALTIPVKSSGLPENSFSPIN